MFDFNSKLFNKNQKILLFIANRWYLNWLLGLNRLPKNLKGIRIDRITPNSIHHIVGNEIIGEFFTRPRFAEALAYNLSPFVYLSNFRKNKMVWRFSPFGIIGCLLLLLLPKESFGFSFIGTTTSYYAGAGDGWTSVGWNYGDNTWAAAHNATSATETDYTGANGTACMVANYSNTYKYYINRCFFPIDTSGLTSSATISSASMFLYSHLENAGQPSGREQVLVEGTQSSTSQLVANDYDNIGSTAWSSVVEATTTQAYKEFALNASGLAGISKTGYTKLAGRDKKDLDNSAPTNYYYNTLYFSEETGTSKDPYLEITYTEASSFTPIIIQF
jgi:hypothetical protein